MLFIQWKFLDSSWKCTELLLRAVPGTDGSTQRELEGGTLFEDIVMDCQDFIDSMLRPSAAAIGNKGHAT